jgi:integrase/recombinase XerD
MKTQSKLSKKRITYVEQACEEIPGFKQFYDDFQEKIVLSGSSGSTLSNYGRRIASLSLHFGKMPEDVPEKEINRYLASLARKSTSPSLSAFKFMVYGLRFYFRMIGKNDKAIRLPSLKHERKLPVVLNHRECLALFKAPDLLKHRVLLSFIYSAGLRAQEASGIKISDIDSERMMIHIRQSKYKKDRYVPLSPLILQGLRKYIRACRPVDYLFNGHEPGSQMSIRGMQWVMRQAKSKCKLQKKVSLHTLRHSYATHLLEFGMDIVTIKELLGHEKITTTMVYLHVAKPLRSNLFSPFDRLYAKD